MDPVTAVGFTAAVVQLVHVSIKVVKTVNEIQERGSSKDVEDADYMASQLAKLSLSVETSLKLESNTQPPNINRNLSADEEELLDIGRKLQHCSQKLQEELQPLKARGDVKGAKRLKVAVKSVLKKDDIIKLQEELEGFREVLELRLLLRLCQRYDVESLRLSDRFENLDDATKQLIAGLANSEYNLTRLVENQAIETRQHITCELNRHKQIQIDQQALEKLKSSLFFPEIFSRQEHIVREFDGFGDSNEWIYEGSSASISSPNSISGYSRESSWDNASDISSAESQEHNWDSFSGSSSTDSGEPRWDSFVDWLRFGTGIYWISGKAGCGKSTLMNYICDDKNRERRVGLLESWADNKTLLTPTFYFWSTGTLLQKSVEGLLRSLIYQMIDECPQLICCFEHMRLFAWTEDRLLKTLSRILTQKESPVAICLFIDGLDEFDGHYSAVIDVINRLDAQSHTKICLSSRPLHEFETAFAARPGLRLQTLTSESIREYTKNRLLRGLKAQSFYREHDMKRIRDLTQEIALKSEGVFLWAVLAVRELSQGLTDLADLTELEEQVSQLPQDFKDLYRQMIQRIKPAYRRKALKFLWSAMTAAYGTLLPRPLTLAQLYFIDNENATRDVPFVPHDITRSELIESCQDLRIRVLSHTSGLLELTQDNVALSSEKILRISVKVFHKTVAEFLRSDNFLLSIMSVEGISEEHLRISYARGCLVNLISLLRQSPRESHGFQKGGRVIKYPYPIGNTTFDSLVQAMEQISIIETTGKTSQTQLITSFCRHLNDETPYNFVIWALSYIYAWSEKRMRNVLRFPLDWIGFGACFSLSYYVSVSLGKPIKEQPSCAKCQGRFQGDEHQIHHDERIFYWDSTQHVEESDQHSRRGLTQRLQWDEKNLPVHSTADTNDDILPETYLLHCCMLPLHIIPHARAVDSFVLMEFLLCAGADPMLQMRWPDLDSLTISPPAGSHQSDVRRMSSFWESWLLYALEARGTWLHGAFIDLPPNNVLLGFTKALLTHGASLSYPIRGNSQHLCLDRHHLTCFEFEMAAIDLLKLIFKGYPKWEVFLSITDLQVPTPKRSILSIFPKRQLHRKVYEERVAHPNDQEAALLWQLFDMWEENRDKRWIERYHREMYSIFRARLPDVKLPGDEGFQWSGSEGDEESESSESEVA